MTKKDIVLKIADENDLKQIDVKDMLQNFVDEIVAGLARGETVELRNFGVFKVRTRKARSGRNPQTGARVSIPAKKVVSFKPGREMKKKVGS